ncbi:MAG: ClpXP protease specificity-enhancing factor SspB, partial [Pseudomonadota bacterium]
MAELNYGQMMQRAMQSLVVEALRTVAENGLPGDHHFYITFQSNQPGVDIPDWLREERGLTGTKAGCNEGDCGACTVMVTDEDGARALNACILFLPQ